MVIETGHIKTYDTVISSYKTIVPYPVKELSLIMKLKLLFKKKQKVHEVLETKCAKDSVLTYYRYSTYKVYKGERIYLSSYVGCTLELHYVDKIIKDE